MKNQYEIRGDTAVIFVTRRNGEVVEFYIDTVDLPTVSSMANSLYAHRCAITGRFYAKFYRRLGTNLYEKPLLHRELINPPKGYVVDHIDGDTRNNRRSNLRVVTQAENLQNRRGAMTNSASGIRGVFRRSDCDRWEAQVVVGRKKHRSLHKTIEEAEGAVREMRKELLPFSNEGEDAA